MKCHYEVLEVSRDADGPEIKSAYRKLALKWHPDKNPDSPSEAKEHFQVVQQAYEVLSDPHERAWYDKHREQILRGSSSEFQDSSLDVFPYFTPSCFKGYHDDEGGFYTVYRKVFDLIIKEDSEFVEDRDEFAIPRFGDSKSDYDSTVGPFYAHWTSYCTKKTYVWLYPYDIKQARDRRLSKLVEKENKKVRQKAKKERNEEIRNLVAFVRKRDRRVLDHSKVMESRVRENRLKQEEFSKQKRLERQKFLAESHVQADWAKFDNVESELEEIEKNLAEEFGEEISEEEEDLYCVACNKVFKTAKAFQNHESSKKHRENVERIREELESEETAESEGREKNVPVDLLGEEKELDSEECSEGEDEIRRQRKKNKRKNVLKLEEEEEEEPVEFLLGDPGENFDFTSKKQKKKNSKKSKSKVENGNDEETETRSKRKNKKEREPSSLEEVDVSHCCVTCRSHFASKNKLFDHLKKTGHGVYLPKSAKSKKNKEIIV